MAKQKFKVKNKVSRTYDRGTFTVIEVKEKVRYEYLLESQDGARFWSDEDSLKASKKAKGK